MGNTIGWAYPTTSEGCDASCWGGGRLATSFPPFVNGGVRSIGESNGRGDEESTFAHRCCRSGATDDMLMGAPAAGPMCIVPSIRSCHSVGSTPDTPHKWGCAPTHVVSNFGSTSGRAAVAIRQRGGIQRLATRDRRYEDVVVPNGAGGALQALESLPYVLEWFTCV